jgi:hypothetical protein
MAYTKVVNSGEGWVLRVAEGASTEQLVEIYDSCISGSRAQRLKQICFGKVGFDGRARTPDWHRLSAQEKERRCASGGSNSEGRRDM